MRLDLPVLQSFKLGRTFKNEVRKRGLVLATP